MMDQSDTLVVKSNSYGFEPQDIEYKDYTLLLINYLHLDLTELKLF